ncbi:MAG: sigma-54-dependent transcriptional regulator [Desulfobaccales bacterium]
MPVGSGVLIVDDDQDLREILARLVRKEGFTPLTAADGGSALELLRLQGAEVMLADVHLPDRDGLELLQKAREMDADLPVIMITAYAGVNQAVAAMRAGAYDYLAKPFQHREVIRLLRRALEERQRRRGSETGPARDSGCCLRESMGPSDAVGRLITDVNRVAQSDFSVVILGETGSGKELVAAAIHRCSPRAAGPSVAVDCGAIPESLLESELFGYEKGAFTSADAKKVGKLEVARGGTLFLDEISNLPPGSQAKLLRVLQEKTIQRLGGTIPLKVDIRLLCATNQDLEEVVAAGSFRRDLYYRLNEFSIQLPPLRERQEDIPYLAGRFLDQTNAELHKEVQGFSGSALEALSSYLWPGNVRQLRSVIRRAVLLARDLITPGHLNIMGTGAPAQSMPPLAPASWRESSLKEIVRLNVDRVEKEVLTQVLQHTHGNKAKAARMLSIDYKTMHLKVKQHGINYH